MAVRTRARTGLLALLLVPALASPAVAAFEAGVEFDDVAPVELAGASAELSLCATGLLRYRRVFKGYAAALYRPEYRALEDRLRSLHARYRSVEPGDRYALTYAPGRGTTLTLNERPLATVEGADFARAYFGIWLGERPVDATLRDALRTAARD